jgi:hypothetical protein
VSVKHWANFNFNFFFSCDIKWKKIKASISKNQSPVGEGIMFFEIPALCG